MNYTEYLSIVTVIVTLICGILAKKSRWFNNNLIPMQNLLIGVAMALICWFITGDFNSAITVSGLLAGGVYDLANNLSKIVKEEK